MLHEAPEINPQNGRKLGNFIRGGVALGIGFAGIGAVLLDRASSVQADNSPTNPYNFTDSLGRGRSISILNGYIDPSTDRQIVKFTDNIYGDFYPDFTNAGCYPEINNPNTKIGSGGMVATEGKIYISVMEGINDVDLGAEVLPDNSDPSNLGNRQCAPKVSLAGRIEGSPLQQIFTTLDGQQKVLDFHVKNSNVSADNVEWYIDRASDGSLVGSWRKKPAPEPTPTPTITPTPEATITPTPTANVTATPTKTPLPLKLKALSLSAKAKISKGLLTVSGKAKTDNRCLPSSVESEINGQTSNANPRTMSAPSTITQVIMTARDACQRILSKTLTVTPKK